MNKILTITVPSYNAESYLLETIPTMLSISNPEKLEIIIVNDGSKDNTLAVAQQLKENYPETIVIVDKENGGHGSTINSGIKIATGKYFKVVDADDWIESKNLSELIDYLEKCNDDEVISPFVKVYTDKNTEEIYSYKPTLNQKTYQYDDFLSEINELPKMHAICIKTEILQENNIQIDENCFYVDLEYNVFPMPYIKTISYFELPIYCYRLGSPTQSVSMSSYIKNIKMHEKVLFALIHFYNSYQNISDIQGKLLESLISGVIDTHANIFLSRSDVKSSKQEFIDFIYRIDEAFHKAREGRKIRLLRMSNFNLFYILSFYLKVRNSLF
ncbi:glycosyltransferase family 2 protein [Haemophilus haemolyticus]|uniref:Glycosyltransferase family 2 protein n=1 Tax=Haemophilus haemolyticus TaxID=726 RepID=A0A502LNA3_HAEHA|nr:glycosyltransferase family 2 protein [Haemophilus haemolyticus]TPH23491.1 glycosyltransferase family 2 protein [Haemophilus haemolyticus]